MSSHRVASRGQHLSSATGVTATQQPGGKDYTTFSTSRDFAGKLTDEGQPQSHPSETR